MHTHIFYSFFARCTPAGLVVCACAPSPLHQTAPSPVGELRRIEADPTVGAVVLASSNRHMFSAGVAHHRGGAPVVRGNSKRETRKQKDVVFGILAIYGTFVRLFVFFSVKKCAWLYIRVTGCLLIRGFLKPENPTPKGPRGQHLFIAGPWNPLGPEHTSAVNHSSCKLACATYTVFTSRFCGLPRLVQM